MADLRRFVVLVPGAGHADLYAENKLDAYRGAADELGLSSIPPGTVAIEVRPVVDSQPLLPLAA